MIKNFLIIFTFCSTLILSVLNNVFAEQKIVQEEVKIDSSIKTESLQDLTSHLEKINKENEPFSKSDIKIDLEALGLDNVEEKKVDTEKKAEIKKEDEIIVEKKAETKEEEKIDIKKEEGEVVGGSLAGGKEIESIANIQNFIKKQEENEKEIENPQEEKGIIQKIRERIIAPKEEQKQEIVIDNKEIEAIKKQEQEKQLQKERQEQKELEITKKNEEKMARLNKLREKYLIKLNEEKYYQENIIIPKEKLLNWSDRFESKELPPLPILQPIRATDNVHIPTILTPRQKVDIVFSAISNKNVGAFNEAYKKAVNPNLYNHAGDTILTYSILTQRYDVMLSVLNKGADPDLPNKLGHTPLDVAIAMLDLKAAQILIDMNADIHYVDEYNRTFLMHACRVGFLPIVQLLVENGADVNIMDDDGITALAIAYRHKKDVVAKYLLKNGAKSWIEKNYKPDKQRMIKDLEKRWERQQINID